jgi:hypothetical protein
MRTFGIALILLLIGSAAMAADSSTPPLVIIAPHAPQRVDVEIGAVELHTGAANVRVAYLPRLAPLPTTLPHSIAEMPNAFQLTGMSMPYRAGLRP